MKLSPFQQAFIRGGKEFGLALPFRTAHPANSLRSFKAMSRDCGPAAPQLSKHYILINRPLYGHSAQYGFSGASDGFNMANSSARAYDRILKVQS